MAKYRRLTNEEILEKVDKMALSRGIWTDTNILSDFFSPVDAVKYGWVGDESDTGKPNARILAKTGLTDPVRIANRCMETTGCLAFTGAGHLLMRYINPSSVALTDAQRKAAGFCSSAPASQCKMWERIMPGHPEFPIGMIEFRGVHLTSQSGKTSLRLRPDSHVAITRKFTVKYTFPMSPKTYHMMLPETPGIVVNGVWQRSVKFDAYFYAYITAGTTLKFAYSNGEQAQNMPRPTLYSVNTRTNLTTMTGGKLTLTVEGNRLDTPHDIYLFVY